MRYEAGPTKELVEESRIATRAIDGRGGYSTEATVAYRVARHDRDYRPFLKCVAGWMSPSLHYLSQVKTGKDKTD
jgi:hypothetical protein